MKTIQKSSTARIAASNHSDVQKRGTSAFSKVLSRIFNTVQECMRTFGQKGHSLQPADKIEIKAVQSQNIQVKTEIKRPKEAPPAPPHSPTVANKPARPEPPAPLAPRNSSSTASAFPPTVAKKTQVTRPTSPPPPPPITTPNQPLMSVRTAPPVPDRANVSQQGPEISVQNGSESVKPDVSINDTKMTPAELTKAWAAIALANASFEKQYRQQK